VSLEDDNVAFENKDEKSEKPRSHLLRRVSKWGDMYRQMDGAQNEAMFGSSSTAGCPFVYWVLRDTVSNAIVGYITEPCPTDNPKLAKHVWSKLDPPVCLPWLQEFARYIAHEERTLVKNFVSARPPHEQQDGSAGNSDLSSSNAQVGRLLQCVIL
jgi:hypothetical protein